MLILKLLLVRAGERGKALHCTVIPCTLYSYTLYTVQLYPVHCTVIPCTLYTVQLYPVHCTVIPCTLYSYTLYSVQVYPVHCNTYTECILEILYVKQERNEKNRKERGLIKSLRLKCTVLGHHVNNTNC